MQSPWKRAAVLLVGALILLVGFPLTGFAQHAGVCYDASLGTLPEAQGWTSFSAYPGNPSPFVSGGLLHESTTVGGQGWQRRDITVDFSQHVTLEANLRVNSSNYVSNVGTGTREGYYLFLNDTNGAPTYSIGLADGGFNIDSINVPNQPLTPFLIADGSFHTYRFDVLNNQASFSIDGVLQGSGFAPFFQGSDVVNVEFGGLAGASVSDTDLSYLCYDTHISPAQQIANLIASTVIANFTSNIQSQLDAKLNAALATLDAAKNNSAATAANQLQAFVNAVRADVQSGKITCAQAMTLVTAAQQIVSALGQPPLVVSLPCP